MGSKECWSLVISLALINALAASNTTSRLCRVQGRAAETAETAETVGREVMAVVVAAVVAVMVGREGEDGRWVKGLKEDIRRVVVGEGRGASGGGGGDQQGI